MQTEMQHDDDVDADGAVDSQSPFIGPAASAAPLSASTAQLQLAHELSLQEFKTEFERHRLLYVIERAC